jgi:riboflavin synthase alpha subunit
MSELNVGDKVTENGVELTVTTVIKDKKDNIIAVEKVGPTTAQEVR